MADPRDLQLRWALFGPLVDRDRPERSAALRSIARMRRVRSFEIELRRSRSLRSAEETRAGAASDTIETIPPLIPDRLWSLRQRLIEGARVLVPGLDVRGGRLSTAALLDTMIEEAFQAEDDSVFWLLYTAVSATYPREHELERFVAALRLAPSKERPLIAVVECISTMVRHHAHYRTIQLAVGMTLVDVDFCARNEFNSGIQRVVRATMGSWEGRYDYVPLVWTGDGTGQRLTVPVEYERVHRWHDRERHDRGSDEPQLDLNLVVPWESTVVLPEVALDRYSERLALQTRYARNRYVAIGYDAIPLTNGTFVSRDGRLTGSRYMRAIKWVDRVLAISASAAEEFAGFRDVVREQGIDGPEVVTLPLPEAGIPVEVDAEIARPQKPVVLSVASFEVRKNQLATLNAAELLWRRGLDFQLVLVGGSHQPWYVEVDDRLTELALAGRPVTLLRGLSEEALAHAYAVASFSVFVSLHEGYGLPVVESLAAGVPVIASRFGSLGELVVDGGCVGVDPSDIEDVAAAMARLLTDPDELARLRDEIRDRSTGTWHDYADAVWENVETMGSHS